ncbi:hypothetical protein GCM10022214_02410 [Actinomadura miaoliensis]|uniref:Uncharacterized protein n=1 Tax=Actinomadura miaoliensis TaxID=430685 RepID=A0ABP7UXQ7_9ACTN
MAHEHIVAGIASALRAGTLTLDAVALEARKAAAADDSPDAPEDESGDGDLADARRLARLPPTGVSCLRWTLYDQLLRRRAGGQDSISKDEMR